MRRTGNINKFVNCPIVCVSNMPIEIVLSTIEAEYISLSQSMKDLIPLRQNMLEVSSVFVKKYDSCNAYTMTFEDSTGAIKL